MTMLNLNDPRIFWTKPEPRIDSSSIWPYTAIDDLLFKSKENFYLINAMDNTVFDVFPSETIIPIHILNAMKKGNATLLIRNIFHGYHSLVGDVYKNFIIKHRIDPKNVLIASESADMDKEIQLVAQKFNLPPCRCRWTRILENATRYHNQDISIDGTLQKKYYEKKFLSYNGNRTWSRNAIVLLLKSQGVIDKGYVSYNSRHTLEELKGLSEETYITVYLSLVTREHLTAHSNSEFPLAPNISASQSPAASRIGELLEANKEELLQLDQILLDKVLANDQLQLGEKEYYQNTYFSVVTETAFPDLAFWDRYTDSTLTDRGRLLSEKIFKPILVQHPFVVVSNPRTLELMRSIGYKTFHPYIDETYDTIEDHATRLLAITDEVKRLCEMSEIEVYEFIDNILPICEYNKKVLLEKTKFSDDLIL